LVAMTAPAGTIYYTLDGSDPRLPGGEIAAGAIAYDGTPLALSDNRQVRSRVLSNNVWSAMNEAEFLAHRPASAENLAIAEIHYNPPGPTEEESTVDPEFGNDDFEFIELHNFGTETIDLAGIEFSDGVLLTLADETTLLEPDARAVVVSNSAAFEARFGTSAIVLGQYDANLSNSGERITLLDAAGKVIQNFVYDDNTPWPETADGDGYSLTRTGTDPTLNGPSSWTAALPTPGSVNTRLGSVVGRHVFYNNSAWDGHDEAADGRDDQAIASDKQALLPGITATLSNYTSYASGINGIMVDIAGGIDTVNLNAAEDFTFRVGNGDTVDDWSPAPPPNSLVVRPGEGVDGSDRVSIVWADRWIKQQWLQVTVQATEHTGLAEPDVFYFGNAIGEAGDRPNNAIVNMTDVIAAGNFPHDATDPAPIDDLYDYNRDRLVDATDQAIARENQTNARTMLRLITPTAADKVMQQASNDFSAAEIDWLYEFERTESMRRTKETSAVDLALRMEDFFV